MELKDIKQAIKDHEGSNVYQQMKVYKDYYYANNPQLLTRWRDRDSRGKTPNWYVPTPYYSTISDTMAGYMFSDVVYSTEDDEYEKEINNILDANHVDIKDMRSGTYALVYNRAYELVYTVGDDKNTDIKLQSLDPLTITPIYDDTIEENLQAVIWKRKPRSTTYEELVDYIDATQWIRYGIPKEGEWVLIDDGFDNPRTLFFDRCPVSEFRAEMIGDQSPFHVVLSYIAALDWAITGNSNEVDRIVDALLLLGKQMDDEELKHADEWKALMGIDKDELTPQYLTKDLSPEFRKYVTELLINEIHKHSHVIDWYSAMGSGDASSKALRTRLFDMDMFSNRIEKVYKKGLMNRVRLIQQLMQFAYGIPMEDVNVEVDLRRTMPTQVEDLYQVLTGVDYLSQKTKQEIVGANPEIEAQRLADERGEVLIDLDTVEAE